MIKKTSTVKSDCQEYIDQISALITKVHQSEEIIYFDIETTGLSAASSYLYLIGCMFFSDNCVYITQWFSQSVNEEKMILKEFESFVKQYRVLVHFNGQTFDIPYLSYKCAEYKITDESARLLSIDLYKALKSYKKLFALPSMRQKELERFLMIKRRDYLDGNELIDIYTSYLAVNHYEKLRSVTSDTEYQADRDSGLPILNYKESEPLLSILLLHNYEDVVNMMSVAQLLSIDKLFHEEFTVCNIIDIETASSNMYISVFLELDNPLPSACGLLSYSFEPYNFITDFLLTINENQAVLNIPVYIGELKLFYPDYKNYFYLPTEDKVIHKSVAEYVDKHHRERAKLSNCYSRCIGRFLPQPSTFFRPFFKTDYKCKYSFFEKSLLTESDSVLLQEYISSILSLI